jgi:hypothetical protein
MKRALTSWDTLRLLRQQGHAWWLRDAFGLPKGNPCANHEFQQRRQPILLHAGHK